MTLIMLSLQRVIILQVLMLDPLLMPMSRPRMILNMALVLLDLVLVHLR